MTAIGVLMTAGSAAAATTTLGDPLTGTITQEDFCIPLCVTANRQLAEPGAQVAAPTSGTIVRWRVVDAEGTFNLRVLAPTGSSGNEFKLVGTSAPGTPAGLGVETFATSLPIEAGDILGIEATDTSAKLGFALIPGSKYDAWFGTFPDGSSTGQNPAYLGEDAGYNADLEYAGGQPGPTGPISTTEHCIVPKLTGKKLKSAKKSLKEADCALGKVTKKGGATARTGKVKKQSPKPGKVLAPGAKITLTLG